MIAALGRPRTLPTAPLGELCDVSIGRTPSRDEAAYWGEGYPWLSIADMNQGRDLCTTKETITRRAVSECNCRAVQPGTVLLSFKLSIGKVGIARVPLFTNEAIAALPIREPRRLTQEYLYWALKSIDLTLGLDRAAKGNTLNKEKLLRISVPIPAPSEQHRVVAILDKADALRARRRAALEQLDSLMQTIFVEMFGDPATNSRRWPDAESLGNVAEIVSGVTKGRSLSGKCTRLVPYLAVSNVQDRALDLSIVKTIPATQNEILRYRLIRDDLLLTEGGDPDKVGRGTLWNDEIEDCIHQNHIFRVRLMDSRFSPVFLCYLVGSARGKKYFLKAAKQTTGIASINMTQLRGFPLIVPPRSLQDAFATAVGQVTRLRRSALDSSAQLDALFASLQHRAFNGEP